jgi:uncharacterized protein YqgC (DUF456 family)
MTIDYLSAIIGVVFGIFLGLPVGIFLGLYIYGKVNKSLHADINFLWAKIKAFLQK